MTSMLDARRRDAVTQAIRELDARIGAANPEDVDPEALALDLTNVALLLGDPDSVRLAFTDYRQVLEDSEIGRATREMLKCAGPLMIRAMLTQDLVDLLAAHERMEQHPQAVHAFYRAMPKLLSDAIERTLPERARETMRAYASRRRQWPTEDPREAWNATVRQDANAAAFFDTHEEYVPRSVRAARVDAMNGRS